MNKDKYDTLGLAAFFKVIVSKLFTNDAMISMNKAVAIDKQDEARRRGSS